MTDTVIQKVIQSAIQFAIQFAIQTQARSARMADQKPRSFSWGPALPISALVGAILLASVASAVPLISEIYYDAVGSDNGQSFVELYGEPGTSTEGLFLEGVNGANGDFGPTIALVGIFSPEGIFVVADDSGDGTSLVPGADQIANFDFQNGPDSIVLRNAAEVLDAVGYGSFGIGEVFAGEGSPAPDPPAGSSLARIFADVDTDDNLADFRIQEIPSPGSFELLSVPEPQPMALLTVGLLALVRSRHRMRRSGSPQLSGKRCQL